jgi:hypothetical protein
MTTYVHTHTYRPILGGSVIEGKASVVKSPTLHTTTVSFRYEGKDTALVREAFEAVAFLYHGLDGEDYGFDVPADFDEVLESGRFGSQENEGRWAGKIANYLVRDMREFEAEFLPPVEPLTAEEREARLRRAIFGE